MLQIHFETFKTPIAMMNLSRAMKHAKGGTQCCLCYFSIRLCLYVQIDKSNGSVSAGVWNHYHCRAGHDCKHTYKGQIATKSQGSKNIHQLSYEQCIMLPTQKKKYSILLFLLAYDYFLKSENTINSQVAAATLIYLYFRERKLPFCLFVKQSPVRLKLIFLISCIAQWIQCLPVVLRKSQ